MLDIIFHKTILILYSIWIILRMIPGYIVIYVIIVVRSLESEIISF